MDCLHATVYRNISLTFFTTSFQQGPCAYRSSLKITNMTNLFCLSMSTNDDGPSAPVLLPNKQQLILELIVNLSPIIMYRMAQEWTVEDILISEVWPI